MPIDPEPLLSLEETHEPLSQKRSSPLPLIIAFCLFLGSIIAYRVITLLPLPTISAPAAPSVKPTTYATPQPTPTSSVLEQDAQFQLDAFVLKLKAGAYYDVSYDAPVVVRTSSFDAGQPMLECVRVANVHSLYTYTFQKDVSLGYSPSISWSAWNTVDIQARDAAAEVQLKETTSKLAEAMKHADGALPVRDGADFILSRLNACSGGWFYPVYKKTFTDSRFTQIAYFEVNAGNGLPYVNPTRVLIIKNVDETGEHWMQIQDSGSFKSKNALEPGLKACDEASLQSGDADLKKSVSCVAKVWNDHRDAAEVAAWVQSRLDELESLR